jgi:hypothetical protein
MSNHGPIDPEIKRRMDALAREFRLGPTGQFPQGKLTARDEGEIRVAIGTVDGKVVLNFGSSVAWIGFTPEQAREIAAAMIEQAKEVAS